MKFTMSPARAYILGMWKGRRTKEGVGVEGHHELCEVFLKACLDEKLAQPGRVKFLEDGAMAKCFFYNSSVRAWLDSEMEKREERLRFKNEFAASYFAGLFDARGGFARNGILFLIGDRTDEIVLLRLGFRAKTEKGKIAVLSKDFYAWIAPYLKIEMMKARK